MSAARQNCPRHHIPARASEGKTFTMLQEKKVTKGGRQATAQQRRLPGSQGGRHSRKPPQAAAPDSGPDDS